VTTPEESISARAGLAHEPVDSADLNPAGLDGIERAGEADVESVPDAVNGRLADLPDEPGEAHVAAYAAAADELAQRLGESGTGQNDDRP
jgi:hypothetical protein